MTSVKLKKGSRLVCVPCGREVIIDCCGASANTIWCCAEPMIKGTNVKSKKMSKRR